VDLISTQTDGGFLIRKIKGLRSKGLRTTERGPQMEGCMGAIPTVRKVRAPQSKGGPGEEGGSGDVHRETDRKGPEG